jgi:FkbM family methyltransferase
VKKFFEDLTHCIPDINPKTIFDVGANVGEFTLNSLNYFPNSKYFCFEPSEKTFNKIKNNIDLENVLINKIALSNLDENLPFTKNHNLCNSLVVNKTSDVYNNQNDKLDIRMRALSKEDIETEIVESKTLDSFCKENNINEIDLLKIDTEGFDFEVLQGAESMLIKNKIGIIYSELTFEKNVNKFSKAFDVIDFLWKFDYEVFRFYEQATVDGKLRRTNVVLTSPAIRSYNKHNIWK